MTVQDRLVPDDLPSVQISEGGQQVGPSRLARFIPNLPLIGVLLGVAWFYGTNLNNFPEYINDDEGTYYAQAWAVLREHTMTHYTYWYDHPPFGWIQIAALIEPLSWLYHPNPANGQSVESIGRAAMMVMMVISSGCLYKIGRNLGMPRGVAIAAPIVWVLAPITVFYGRSVYLDNIDMMWLLVTLSLVSGKPKLQYYILGGVAFAGAVLSKETAIIALPALLLAIWTYSWPSIRKFALVGFGVSATLVMSIYVLYALVKNELLPGHGHVSLWWALQWQVANRGSSGFLFTNGSGANQLLDSWLAHDKVLIEAGFAATVPALFLRKFRPVALVPVFYLLVAMKPGYLPAMFVITALPFLALAIVYVGWTAWRIAASRPRAMRVPLHTALAVALVVATLAVIPGWGRYDKAAVTANANAPYEQALIYVANNLPRDSRILTDDTTWNDLVALGWSGKRWYGPIWHFKLDRDPEAQKNMPDAWRDVGYVLLGREMQVLINTINIDWQNSPQVVSALENSDEVKAWAPPDCRSRYGRSIRVVRRAVTSGYALGMNRPGPIRTGRAAAPPRKLPAGA